jgi:hypothetical protein
VGSFLGEAVASFVGEAGSFVGENGGFGSCFGEAGFFFSPELSKS